MMFEVGDIVRRIKGNSGGMTVGDTATVKEVVNKTITDNDLKEIINKKLLNIILFMETCTNECN